MLNARDNFLETLHHGKPDAFVNEWEPFGFVFDPLMGVTLIAQPGKYVVDGWGTTIYMGEDEPGAMPIVRDDNKAIPDITEWKKYIKSPDIKQKLDWTAAKEQAEAIHKENKLTVSLMATGLFEQSHYLMGFEDTLMNFLLEPEAMEELLDAVAEYRFQYAKLLVDNLKPDVILSHDDWGCKRSLFMQPDTWREFFKDHYKRIYGYMKDHGVIVIHHADSFCEPIVEDMVDIGIDVWQGVLPENDIVKLQKQLDGRMTLMGGIDATIDRKDSTEEEIRADVRRACSTYGPGGHYIPCMTYGLAGTIYPKTDEVIADEIDRYNKETYGV